MAKAGSNKGFKCKANTYYWGFYLGDHYCVDCPDGTFSLGCSNCEGPLCAIKGPKALVGKCIADKTATMCRALKSTCPRGKYINKLSAMQCTACPKGKWQSKSNRGSCNNCPTGTYMSKTGMYGCYSCPVGRFNSKPGAANCVKCSKAKSGHYGYTTAKRSKSQAECKYGRCARGKYTGVGYITCFACPAGRYQFKTKQYLPLLPNGEIRPQGQLQMHQLPDGQDHRYGALGYWWQGRQRLQERHRHHKVQVPSWPLHSLAQCCKEVYLLLELPEGQVWQN